MIERIALRRLQQVKATLPPAGYYREQLIGKLKRLASVAPLPADLARQGLQWRVADLAAIRGRLTRQPVTGAQIEKLKGIL